jgi:atypical dual specificity phosphatase
LSEKNNLPRNFSWLEPSKIAGCGRPESEEELRALKEQGIGAIVSLTGTPLSPEIVSKFGFEYLHSHIPETPTIDQLEQIMRFVEQQNAQSRPVLVHCGEGKGITGTVLSAYLVYNGMHADEAIQLVREKRPGSIENLDQENAIRIFERTLRPK